MKEGKNGLAQQEQSGNTGRRVLPLQTDAPEWQQISVAGQPEFRVVRSDGYAISDARDALNLDLIHRFLSEASYWAQGLDRATLQRALQHSLPFGLYAPNGEQVGFCRLVTDRAIFAYLRDVFVLDAHRGRGLATWLSSEVQRHPEVIGVRSWLLATRDAHEVYRRAGFESVPHPEWYMRIKKQAS